MKEEKRTRTFKGIISLVILRHLWNEPNYGYQLEREVNRSLDQRLSNGEIYSIIKNLEIRGLVRNKVDHQIVKNRKYYEISSEGKRYLINQVRTLKSAIGSIEEIIEFVNTMTQEDKEKSITTPPP
ncbi:MAG: PadR family transcriptional regulator [Thermoplasmatales archaeon]|jgi:DNA-binding PadR family transcriptional regulator|nr:PadR family transcriptional regulator [Candidatus Thermoplasmatota archaeon]MDA8055246.1 PadR family transcriptional regulator [Thermoplasmatales archaeon]